MTSRITAAQQWLWQKHQARMVERIAANVARHVVMLVRDFTAGHLSLRAMSLVYTTLLSLVPMLALAFSMFKALGVHNALKPVLQRFLEPLGGRADELAENVIGFVENIQVGVLGSLGIGLLLYAAISLIQKVESSFNWIWRVKRSRSMGARFSEYLSVLIVGPFAIFLSVGITASALSSDIVQSLATIEPFGTMIIGLAKLIPYLIIIGVFSFLYAFIPNTRVPLHAAIGAGVFAGFLWQTASLAFASFVASSGNYSAIYSSFAIIIFLLIWLYVGWLILMLGCQLAYYLAHPESVQRDPRENVASPRTVEQLGLAIVAEAAQRGVDGRLHASREDLSRLLMAPSEHVDPVIDTLLRCRILAETSEMPPRLLLARDADSLTLDTLWRMLRRGRRSALRTRDLQQPSMLRAFDVLGTVEASFAEDLGKLTIREWLQQQMPQQG